MDREEANVIRTLNDMRVIMGLMPMEIDLKLCKAARGHSADMQRLDFFSHESPVEGKKTFSDRAKLADTKAHGENILKGVASGSKAVEEWFKSPGHHKNMFRPWGYQGVGRIGSTWTQLFRQ